MSIGERITALRKEQNISQAQLAKSLDVTRQAVSKWENDTAAPDTLKLIRLAEILNTQVEYLATGQKPDYEPAPLVVNVVEKVDRIVEQVVEKPVIKKVIRVKYLRNPIEFAIIGIVCFALGIAVGLLF